MTVSRARTETAEREKRKMKMFVWLLPCAAAFSSGTGGDTSTMSCDAINVCKGGSEQRTCPVGMEEVAYPTRDDHYSIRTKRGPFDGSDPTTYAPGERISIYITVEKKWIQRKIRKGKLVCLCNGRWRGQYDKNGGCRDYRGEKCTVPFLEDSSYKGLLLYAVDDKENKVGSWDLPYQTPQQFWLPPDKACANKAVMHTHAQDKNYQHKFDFIAPDPGVGPITFRALIKHGETLMGAFYWPVAPAMPKAEQMNEPEDGKTGGDLTLTQAAGTTQIWYQATDRTQSCDDVCQAINLQCDETKLVNAEDDPSLVRAGVAPFLTIAEPAIAQCQDFLPALAGTPEQWMLFRTKKSPQCITHTNPSRCDAKPPPNDPLSTVRLCPCKQNRRRLSFRPPNALPTSTEQAARKAGCPQFKVSGRRLSGAAVNSAAPTPSFSLSTTFTFGIFSALSGGTARTLSLSLLSVAILSHVTPRAFAHNWVWNPLTRSRNLASMTQPCKNRATQLPGIHVNRGQEFEVEWSSGHGGEQARFTLVAAEDESKLAHASRSAMNKVRDAAPASAFLTNPRWNKRHLSWENSQKGAENFKYGELISAHEAEGKTLQTKESDPDYIVRDEAFFCSDMGRHKDSPSIGHCYQWEGGLQQFTFPDSLLSLDSRYVRTSPHTTNYSDPD